MLKESTNRNQFERVAAPLTVRSSPLVLTQRETIEALAVAAPKVVRILWDIINDEAKPAAARVQAGKVLLDRAGYVPPTPAKVDEGNAKQLTEMTPDELRDTIDKNDAAIQEMERVLSERARDVSAPNAGDDTDKAAGMLD